MVVNKPRQVTGTCPFLRADEEGDSNICLAHPEAPKWITPRYVKSFCLTTRPFACSRFVHADPELQRAYLRRLARGLPEKSPEGDVAQIAWDVFTEPNVRHARKEIKHLKSQRAGVSPARAQRHNTPSHRRSSKPNDGDEFVQGSGLTDAVRVPAIVATPPPTVRAEGERAEVIAVPELREGNPFQRDAADEGVASQELHVNPIASTARTESLLSSDIEAVPPGSTLRTAIREVATFSNRCRLPYIGTTPCTRQVQACALRNISGAPGMRVRWSRTRSGEENNPTTTRSVGRSARVRTNMSGVERYPACFVMISGPASVSTNVSSALAPVIDGFQAKACPTSIWSCVRGVATTSRVA
jgi:hypothetical protein